jgi:hypothetical protein
VKREKYYIVTANPRAARDAETRWSRWEKKCAEARRLYGMLSERRIIALIRKRRELS